jgi:hypothetical protein
MALTADGEECDNAEQREGRGQQNSDAAAKRADEVLPLRRRERLAAHRTLSRGRLRRHDRRENDESNQEESVSLHLLTAAAAAPAVRMV